MLKKSVMIGLVIFLIMSIITLSISENFLKLKRMTIGKERLPWIF